MLAPSRLTVLLTAACALCALSAWQHRAPAPIPLGDELRVNTLSDGIQQSASVAVRPTGDFVVAWQSEVAGLGDEVRARRFDARGAALGGEIPVNTFTRSSQNSPSVALDAAGNFVVVWQSLMSNNFEIRARRFDARGVAEGPEIAVTKGSGEAHSAPRVAMDAKGAFVVVWESALAGSYEIRARRFSARGMPLGEEIAVNTVTVSSQRAPSVAMAAGGEFAVVWRCNRTGHFVVRARCFSADGAPRSDELQVHAAARSDQLAPAIAMAADGRFVVAWESAQDDGYEIRARRFSTLGRAQGAEVVVYPGTTGDELAPAVAMSAEGAFVVAWHSRIGKNYHVRAQAFTATGATQGQALLVSSNSVGTQKSAAVASAADGGDFVVTWHSDAAGDWNVAARGFRRPRWLDYAR